MGRGGKKDDERRLFGTFCSFPPAQKGSIHSFAFAKAQKGTLSSVIRDFFWALDLQNSQEAIFVEVSEIWVQMLYLADFWGS